MYTLSCPLMTSSLSVLPTDHYKQRFHSVWLSVLGYWVWGNEYQLYHRCLLYDVIPFHFLTIGSAHTIFDCWYCRQVRVEWFGQDRNVSSCDQESVRWRSPPYRQRDSIARADWQVCHVWCSVWIRHPDSCVHPAVRGFFHQPRQCITSLITITTIVCFAFRPGNGPAASTGCLGCLAKQWWRRRVAIRLYKVNMYSHLILLPGRKIII